MLKIESKCVTGIDKYSKRRRMHVWNQVKIDGEWYNCDITNDSVNINENRRVEYCLVSDEELFLYEAISENAEKCNKTWDGSFLKNSNWGQALFKIFEMGDRLDLEK